MAKRGTPVFKSILDYVDPKAIRLQVTATDWVDVIALLGCRLVASGSVRPEFIQSVVALEQARPTGVRFSKGVNIAVPRTDPEFVIRPCLALATLAQPVLFGGMDRPDELVPVRLVLLMVSSEPAGQLRALSRVAGMFQGNRTIGDLVGAQSIAYVTALICNSRDALITTPTTGQLADDLRFVQ